MFPNVKDKLELVWNVGQEALERFHFMVKCFWGLTAQVLVIMMLE